MKVVDRLKGMANTFLEKPPAEKEKFPISKREVISEGSFKRVLGNRLRQKKFGK